MAVGPVREERRPGEITGGEDALDAGAQGVVGDDEAPVERHAGLLVAQPLAHRPAADAHESHGGRQLLAVGEAHRDAALIGGEHLLDLGLQPQLDAGALERLPQRLAGALVLAGKELLEHLDDGDPRAESGEDRGELAADDAAADDQHAVGDVIDLEDLVARVHARVGEVEQRQAQRLRAAGEHEGVALDLQRLAGPTVAATGDRLDAHTPRADQLAVAGDDLDLARLEQVLDAGALVGDHLVLAPHEGREIDADLAHLRRQRPRHRAPGAGARRRRPWPWWGCSRG